MKELKISLMIIFAVFIGWALEGLHILPEVRIHTVWLGTENLTVYQEAPFEWGSSNMMGHGGYIPDIYTLKYLPSVGWIVSTNSSVQRLQGWLNEHPNLP